MIPKKIHFCWFGKNEYPEKVRYCMDSWKVFLSDYEFVLWNEDTFDINAVPFVKQAYAEKKYAFVSDYVRVYALEKYGGIYLDTDIEVCKSFSPLLEHRLILGTDEGGFLTAFMAAEPHHVYFQKLLAFYDGMTFIRNDGTLNTEVNNTWMQQTLASFGYQISNAKQTLQEGIVVYPCEYFHAKSLTSGKVMTTEKTYCIHHHTLLWITPKTKMIKFVRMKILVPILGAERYTKLVGRVKKFRK